MTDDRTNPGPHGLTAHEARNRAAWDAFSDEYQQRHGSQLAGSGGNAWGTAQIPESELQVLGIVDDKDILELGCGAAQWSIALALRGARPVGLDISARQLEHARRLMAEAGVAFPLIHASAEHVPLPDATFDIVFCDHGAMTFADPYCAPNSRCPRRDGAPFVFNLRDRFQDNTKTSALPTTGRVQQPGSLVVRPRPTGHNRAGRAEGAGAPFGET